MSYYIGPPAPLSAGQNLDLQPNACLRQMKLTRFLQVNSMMTNSTGERMMGQVADDMLDGTCCQFCGVWNDDLLAAGKDWKEEDPPVKWEPPGFPWTCEDCLETHS